MWNSFRPGPSGPRILAIALLGVVATGRTTRVDEVERNWATGATVTQSSTALGGVPSRAIDGNRNGNWTAGSVTHTNQENEPYWQVDLGEAHDIDEIRIWNRTDCCGERLRDLMVFFVNNKVGFQHRDISSLMGENTGPSPVTAVYFKPVFNHAGDPDPSGTGQLAVTTLRFNGDDCAQPGQPGCKMRFVRIQLAGQGPLSLAEVEIIEKGKIAGPASVGRAVGWVPTGVTTSGSGVALAASGERLLLYYRGSDGLLHGSDNLASGPAIAGSPAIGTEAPTAVVDASGRGFVAVRTTGGAVAIGEGDAGSGALGSATWTTLGQTATVPAVATACGRAVASWLDGGRLMAAWKAIDPAATWSAAAVVTGAAASAPTLAVNNRGEIGVGFLGNSGSIQFAMLPCVASGTSPAWTTVTTLVGFAKGGRVSLAAYGPHFMAATLGGNDRGYFAIQHTVGPAEEWQGFEPIPGSQRGDPGLPILETPRLFVMSGAIVAAAREKQSQGTHYWLKYPNRLAPGDAWAGGRPVGGAGSSAMAPAMASLGVSQLWGTWNAPSELYVAALGIGDRRVYALNLGRFMAGDVFKYDLGLDITGMQDIAPQADRGVDPTMAPNYLEQMLTLLTLPAAARKAVVVTQCGQLNLATRLELDRNYGSAQFDPRQCPYKVKEGTGFMAADLLIHEWLHMDAAVRKLPTAAGFAAAFPFDGSSMVPANSGMKACSANPQCGNDLCEKAGDDHGGMRARASTQDYDPAETSIRRWDNTFVCVTTGGPQNRRPQGGLIWYDIGTADHAFIHMAMAYRWYGEDLRAWVAQDLANGNDQLQRRYNWIKANYFGGVEYNGRFGATGALPASDRSQGMIGMPDR